MVERGLSPRLRHSPIPLERLAPRPQRCRVRLKRCPVPLERLNHRAQPPDLPRHARVFRLEETDYAALAYQRSLHLRHVRQKVRGVAAGRRGRGGEGREPLREAVKAELSAESG
jgi:hypothetical protein